MINFERSCHVQLEIFWKRVSVKGKNPQKFSIFEAIFLKPNQLNTTKKNVNVSDKFGAFIPRSAKKISFFETIIRKEELKSATKNL